MSYNHIFQPIAFLITYTTSINLICYHFIEFSLLHPLYIIRHMDMIYRPPFSLTVKTCDSSLYHVYLILFISNIPSCFWYAIYTESIISQTMSHISNSIQLVYYIILILYHIYGIYIV